MSSALAPIIYFTCIIGIIVTLFSFSSCIIILFSLLLLFTFLTRCHTKPMPRIFNFVLLIIAIVFALDSTTLSLRLSLRNITTGLLMIKLPGLICSRRRIVLIWNNIAILNSLFIVLVIIKCNINKLFICLTWGKIRTIRLNRLLWKI